MSMLLKSWITINKLSVAEAARLFSVDNSTVYRYIHENGIPLPPTMVRIYKITQSAVDANSFYHLTSDIFDRMAKQTRIREGK